MKNWENNIISSGFSIRQALERLNNLGIASAVLFIVDEKGLLVGTLSDGDIRRGLLKNGAMHDNVATVMNRNYYKVYQNGIDKDLIRELKEKKIVYVPVIDQHGAIHSIVNLEEYKEIIPVEAVIMAGGKGERLMPLTKDIPKPLLKIGNKPILEHNIDRLAKYGINNINICLNYLGEQIENYLGDGAQKEIRIRYIRESRPLGTIGALGLAKNFSHDTILVMNADLLTNIDFANFYNAFVNSGAEMAVATVPHHVDMPYAILELDEERVISLHEKPRYTYFANAGIYLIKSELLSYIPKADFFNATDLMEAVISDKRKLINYPILEYWMDIGRLNDYQKAQEDIKHLDM